MHNTTAINQHYFIMLFSNYVIISYYYHSLTVMRLSEEDKQGSFVGLTLEEEAKLFLWLADTFISLVFYHIP